MFRKSIPGFEQIVIREILKGRDRDQKIHELTCKPISAAAVNGLSVNGRVLLRKGKALPTVDVKSGMTEFVHFIENELSKHEDAKAVLVAHNGHKFDKAFLVKYMKRYGLDKHSIWERLLFGDTIFFARKTFGWNRSRLGDVHKRLCPNKTFDAHNAVGDCQAVTNILNIWRKEMDGCEEKLLALLQPIPSNKVMI